jgi:NAD(P)H-dependent flavin oxidoreductase YrpB (nitropropane dioxygenase family)
MKGESAFLEYSLAAAPCGVDQEIEVARAFEDGGGLGVVGVVAGDADNMRGQIRGCDRPAGGEDV